MSTFRNAAMPVKLIRLGSVRPGEKPSRSSRSKMDGEAIISEALAIALYRVITLKATQKLRRRIWQHDYCRP